MIWTEQRVAELKRLLEEGLSASQAAARLGNGITRSAVIGFVHRNRELLRFSRAPSENAGVKRQSKPRSLSPIFLAVMDGKRKRCAIIIEEAEEDLPEGLDIWQLNSRSCRWPVSGEGYLTRFCGKRKQQNCPYCDVHAMMAYRSA